MDVFRGDEQPPKAEAKAEPPKAEAEAPKKKKKAPQPKKEPSEKTAKDAAAAEPQRHLPGFALLRVERDRIDRVRAAISGKIKKRSEDGKSVGVCGILNDQLLKFYDGVRADFVKEFGKYLKD